MSRFVSHSSQRMSRALNLILVVTTIVCFIGLSAAAFGASPVEEMAKMGTTDPKGDSWQAIQHSLAQFAHPEFILRLFSALAWPWPAPG